MVTDKTKINEIWAEFNSKLRQFVVGKVNNTFDADDILQDVFLKIHKNLDKVNQSKNMQNYIFAITRNTINDYFRNKKPNCDVNEFPIEWKPEENVNLNHQIAENCVRPLIYLMPPKYRDALILTEYKEMSQKDLATHLGISYSGAKSRVQRGKILLKEYLQNFCAVQSDNYGNLSHKGSSACNC